MATVFDVAKYILQKKGRMSTWKLHKLCYYTQAWALASSDNNPIFEEEFEDWANGQVCWELLNQHRGAYTIRKNDLRIGSEYNLLPEEVEIIDIVLASYWKKEPYWLRERTNSTDPWITTKDSMPPDTLSPKNIPEDIIGAYYVNL